MNCIKCGSELEHGAKFCENCGEPVVAVSVAEQTAPIENLTIVEQTKEVDGGNSEVKSEEPTDSAGSSVNNAAVDETLINLTKIYNDAVNQQIAEGNLSPDAQDKIKQQQAEADKLSEQMNKVQNIFGTVAKISDNKIKNGLTNISSMSPQESIKNKASQFANKHRKKLIIATSILALIVIIAVVAVCATVFSTGNKDMTLENYDKIVKGMTYSKVCDILGDKGEVVTTSSIGGTKMDVYKWVSGKGTNYKLITISFINDKVESKTAVGLS